MKVYAQSIKAEVWKQLEAIFKKYAGGKNYITPAQIEKVLVEVLREETPVQRGYVLKNMFRLDADNNGQIDCEQLGNFFLKNHCGQIALQRMHLAEKMLEGAQRKMNLQEFKVLLKNAYEFLSIKIDPEAAEAIFNNTDSDKDGWITYKEYFSFIQAHIMKIKQPLQIQRKPSPRKIHSRLRKFIWGAVRKLFEKYIKDGEIDGKQLGKILKEIMKAQSDVDLAFILQQASNKGFDEVAIKFQQLASFFIIHLADLGLSKFSKQHPSKRSLTKDEFVLVFIESYALLDSYRITNQLLYGFFEKIDTNHDGLISFSEYNEWIRSFLAITNYTFEEYYFELDDENLPQGNHAILGINQLLQKYKTEEFEFNFSSLDLARRARANCLRLIEKYDVNKDKNMEQPQIIQTLKILMKSDQFDVFYVTANVFRYDQDEDGFVNYNQLADFFLQMHNGELALQRLHKINAFSQGNLRVMNLEEFIKVMEYGLSFIETVATKDQLTTLFCDIDPKKDGKISYSRFLKFLRVYFGTKSIARAESMSREKSEPLTRQNSLERLSPDQKFARLIITELTAILRNYTAFQTVDKQQIIRFLKEIFNLSNLEIDYVLRNIFRYLVSKSGMALEMELVRIFLYIFFAEITLLKMHKTGKIKRSEERLISLQQFLELIDRATKWMKRQIPKDILVQIFEKLDTNKDGFITYLEFINFIKTHFNNKKTQQMIEWSFPELEYQKSEKSQKDQPLYEQIWSELRALYHHYVKGQYLQYSELEPLVKQVLHQTDESELLYVFWNMFRADPNNDKNIEFEEFAPFILSHAGEIALQRFHYQQVLGKTSLSKTQLKLVFREAYKFLKTIDKEDDILDWVFAELDTDKDGFVTYQQYLTWIENVISKNVR